jgi:hypothetical protein
MQIHDRLELNIAADLVLGEHWKGILSPHDRLDVKGERFGSVS